MVSSTNGTERYLTLMSDVASCPQSSPFLHTDRIMVDETVLDEVMTGQRRGFSGTADAGCLAVEDIKAVDDPVAFTGQVDHEAGLFNAWIGRFDEIVVGIAAVCPVEQAVRGQ